MERKATLCTIGFEVLDKHNYMYWSARVKTYLIAHDLWDIVETIREPQKQEDDEAACKAWRRKNSMTLHLIQISCGQDAYSMIQKESSAKKAWNTLARNYNTQKNTNPGTLSFSFFLIFSPSSSLRYQSLHLPLICLDAQTKSTF